MGDGGHGYEEKWERKRKRNREERKRRRREEMKRRNEESGVSMNAWSEHGGWEREERKKMRKWKKVVDEVAMGGKEWDKRED